MTHGSFFVNSAKHPNCPFGRTTSAPRKGLRPSKCKFSPRFHCHCRFPRSKQKKKENVLDTHRSLLNFLAPPTQPLLALFQKAKGDMASLHPRARSSSDCTFASRASPGPIVYWLKRQDASGRVRRTYTETAPGGPGGSSRGVKSRVPQAAIWRLSPPVN